MDSGEPDAEATPDEKKRAKKGKSESPSPADEHAYEDAWYKVLKRRSQDKAKEDED